ncbi:hypothetical protein [Bremerella sp. P1]|uniref:hypothetical protein n=1 Tax=Bremerella sp. P1 TaxID=3026424 RepID=UPI002368EB3A|nr:hypothetical protein [Bremerella sp. P1]WDI43800.1 hypothetical protein PSR63_07545 [Bremerella sp. P1]
MADALASEPTSYWKSLSLQRGVLLAALIPLSISLVLRFLMIGGPPCTDEGSYVAIGMHRGLQARPLAPVGLYPLLVVQGFGVSPEAPLFRPRVVDAIVAAIGAGLLGFFLYRMSNAWIATLVTSAYVVVVNQYVNFGFRNSITAATALLLLSLILIQSKSLRAMFIAGLLIPFVALLREPMIFVPIPILAYAFVQQRWRGAAWCLAGMVIGGLLGLSLLHFISGSVGETLIAFQKQVGVFKVLPSSGAMVTQTAFRFISAQWWFLIPAVIAIPLTIYYKRFGTLIVAALFLAIIAPEVFSKCPVMYHFAQGCLACSLLIAVGLYQALELWKSQNENRMPRVALGIAAGLLTLSAAWGIYQSTHGYSEMARQSRHFYPIMVDGNWDNSLKEEDFYLLLADKLRTNANPDDRMIVSGHYWVLYPLTKMEPADLEYPELTFASHATEDDFQALCERLRSQPPEFFVETYRETQEARFRDIWPEFDDQYEVMLDVPINPAIRYGIFGGRIWQKKSSNASINVAAKDDALPAR